MKIYESFQYFWDDVNSSGFAKWQVVEIIHTSDTDYQLQLRSGKNELGFQPLSVVFANPFTKETKQVLIKNVTDEVATKFRNYCREQYLESFPKRFGSFRPNEFHAFAEYDSWESFYNTWLERAGKPVFNLNIPLLVDHTPQVEYWTRKQTGQDVMPYQRLLITTYFVHKKQFFDFFIKDVDDAKAETIKLLLSSRIGLNIDLLYSKPDKAHDRNRT